MGLIAVKLCSYGDTSYSLVRHFCCRMYLLATMPLRSYVTEIANRMVSRQLMVSDQIENKKTHNFIAEHS